MTIHRIESAPEIETFRSQVRLKTDGVGIQSRFDELLATAEGSSPSANVTPTDAETAAEILRLQMLRSSLSPADADSDHAPLPTAGLLTKTLAAFLEQQKQDQTQEQTASREVVLPVLPMPEDPAGGSPVADRSLEAIVNRASRRYGVEASLIKAVIKAESNFNTHAVSHAGAQGLMQLMPATARGLGVRDSFDAEENVMAGTRFLKDMLNRYGGNVDVALAAYNWGPGNVDRRGDSLPRETREYLAKVKRYYRDYSV